MRKTRDKGSRNRQNNTSEKCAKQNGKRGLKTTTSNDPMWYASNPDILRDAASYPFSQALGTTVERGNTFPEFTVDNNAIPGICRIDLKPSLGLSITRDSAVNVAATAMYTYVRHANSGHSNYDSPDLMIYCVAMAQIYAFINWCQRLYGLATLYAQKNRYLPRHLITTMGVNPDSITNNLASFRYWINVMVSKASSLAVPATMSYFSRTAFLYANIYSESDSIKDQVYYFHPESWLKFTFNSGSEGGGYLASTKLTATGTDGLTLAEIQRFGEELIGSILSDEDMNIMSGDILKAYGVDHIIKLTALPEMYTTIPIYDPLVLSQIHNATVMEVEDFNIQQSTDKSYIESIPFISWSDDNIFARAKICNLCLNKLLTVDVLDPGPAEVVEGTRLMVTGDSSASTNAGYYVFTGTEIPTACRFYTLNSKNILQEVMYNGALVHNAAISNLVKAFKYAPTIFMYSAPGDDRPVGFCESIDNYTVLNFTDITKLHDVCLMNMLAVPSIAKV